MLPPSAASPARASLRRRALAMIYELLLVSAVVLAGAVVLVPATLGLDPLIARPLLQIALTGLVAVYFIWQWTHGGQTLAMKTWRIRLVGPGGTPPGVRRALLRFLLGLAGTLALGAGFAWAGIDRERQFLHDRLAGTRIVNAENGTQQADR